MQVAGNKRKAFVLPDKSKRVRTDYRNSPFADIFRVANCHEEPTRLDLSSTKRNARNKVFALDKSYVLKVVNLPDDAPTRNSLLETRVHAHLSTHFHMPFICKVYHHGVSLTTPQKFFGRKPSTFLFLERALFDLEEFSSTAVSADVLAGPIVQAVLAFASLPLFGCVHNDATARNVFVKKTELKQCDIRAVGRTVRVHTGGFLSLLADFGVAEIPDWHEDARRNEEAPPFDTIGSYYYNDIGQYFPDARPDGYEDIDANGAIRNALCLGGIRNFERDVATFLLHCILLLHERGEVGEILADKLHAIAFFLCDAKALTAEDFYVKVCDALCSHQLATRISSDARPSDTVYELPCRKRLEMMKSVLLDWVQTK